VPNRLDKAAGIGRAADACAGAGFHEKGLEVALDIEQLLYEATALLNAASLINRITQPQNLRLAWRRVASNRGARSSGVDKVTVKHIETRIGVERFLTMMRATLLDGSYRPRPVRRVMIPKAVRSHAVP
jgi:hypothetical protein